MAEEAKPPVEDQNEKVSDLPVLETEIKPDTVETPENEKANDIDVERGETHGAPPPPPPPKGPNIYDILLLLGILVMLIWPWIFFGVVWSREGIQMTNHVAKVVVNNPHATTYIITLICSILSMLVTAFFSLAIIRFAQEMVTRYSPTRPFHLTALLAIRRQAWPWGTSWNDIKGLLSKDKWWVTLLVVLCVLTFPHLVSTTESLITPNAFTRNSSLVAHELDLATTNDTCLNWYRSHPIQNPCDWESYKGLYFSTCLGEIQMVDVLEAGRGNILELATNNSESLTFSQLGGEGGLRFLGSILGILPNGPNGVTVFNTLEPSPFDNPHIVEGMLSYNYSLNYQGLFSSINCSYKQPASAVRPGFPTYSNISMQYSGSCSSQGLSVVLTNVSYLFSPLGTNTLLYWACRSPLNSTGPPTYYVYLQGYTGEYQDLFGNITCQISPLQPEALHVQYESLANIFYATENFIPGNASATNVFSTLLVEYALKGLAAVVSQGQNTDSNLVAESVITFGIKSFGLTPHDASDKYLTLFERMIQGVIEYQVTYLRLIYSTVDNRPDSCTRQVDGSVSYEIFGWFVGSENIGFLIPLTLINGAALIALVLALAHAKYVGWHHPRTSRRVRVAEDPKDSDGVPDEWKEQVAYQPRSILGENFQAVKDVLIDTGKGIAQTAAQAVPSMVVK